MDPGFELRAARRAPGYLLAGVILDPVSPQAMRLVPGAVAVGIRTETIRETGPLDQLRASYPGWPVAMAQDCVIVPTFSDGRAGQVGHTIRGRTRGRGLLDWLETLWAEESRFAHPDHAADAAVELFEDVVRQGTMTAFLVGAPQVDALAALFDTPRVGRWYAGNVLTDTLAPAEYRQPTSIAITGLEDSAFRFGGRYVISPRMVPACSDDLLKAAGGLALDEVYVQTALGVDRDEVSLTAQISDGMAGAELLDRAGLLNSRTLLSHCNYLDEREWRVLSALDCVIIHTPSADEALGAERMPLEKVREHNLRWALGSDVGAGPSASMLHVMQAFLRVHQGKATVRPSEALYRACCVIPELLGHEATGRFAPGHSADFVVFHCPEAARERTADRCLLALVRGSVAELESRPIATIHRGHLVSGALPDLSF